VHAWGVPSWDQCVVEYWARRAEGAASAIVDELPAAAPLGSFVVPIERPGVRRAVLTRTLGRYGAADEIGWSSVFDPE